MGGRTISVDEEGNVTSVSSDASGREDVRSRLRWFAWLLDSSIPVPGTRLTIGIDALIGLFPFLGDLLGVALSSYIINEAARLGAPRAVLLRMAFNVGVEGIVGMIPLAGDVFDAAWKANQKNVRLLDAWMDRPRAAERSSRLFGIVLVAGIAIFLILLVAAAFSLARWLAGFL
ncbi:MAG TPA: DUF4112 domain-containing protein [Burkholderiales bacterium]|jgi:hypothetical protein|nr:DUF4112 domain-containing protein [Burkholderiales bacterium]